MNEILPADMTRDEAVIYCYDNMPTVYNQIKAHHTVQDIFYMMYLCRLSQGQKKNESKGPMEPPNA